MNIGEAVRELEVAPLAWPEPVKQIPENVPTAVPVHVQEESR